jgi:hypothetical protein
VRLAIADPPYPPIRAAHPRNDKPRASFWYGDSLPTSGTNMPRADHHAAAIEWDDPARHRALLEQVDAEYDGWAIATAHDGLRCYGELPRGARVMIWHRPNGGVGAARIRNVWEAVIIRPPNGRLSSRLMGGQIPDLLTCPSPRVGFAGSKPAEWTRWILRCLGYDPRVDTVDDLFPGSGLVSDVIREMSA